MRGSRPQTLTGFADSPIGLAALMLVHDARSPELISEVTIPVAVSVFPEQSMKRFARASGRFAR